MISSVHIDNKKKDKLVLGKEPTQGLEHTLTAGKIYASNFTITKNKFCLSLHYKRANSYLFVNSTEIIKFKAKDSEIVPNPLCLGNKLSLYHLLLHLILSKSYSLILIFFYVFLHLLLMLLQLIRKELKHF